MATTPAGERARAAAVRVGAWPMWVLGLVVLIDQVDQNLVRGVVPQLKADFGIDDFGIGILISAFVLVNGIVTVPAGYLADRWHRTRTIGHTVVAWSGITMLTAASQNFGQLVAGRALMSRYRLATPSARDAPDGPRMPRTATTGALDRTRTTWSGSTPAAPRSNRPCLPAGTATSPTSRGASPPPGA